MSKSVRVYVVFALGMAAILGAPAVALAQFRPASAQAQAAVGEDYHVEASYAWWNAEPGLIVNSESLGILGSDVNLINDLGIEQQRLLAVTRARGEHHLAATSESSRSGSASSVSCFGRPRSTA